MTRRGCGAGGKPIIVSAQAAGADMQKTLDRVAAAGLAMGALFGLGGSLVDQAALRGIFWGIDGAGLVMAASLLTLKYFRQGSDLAAAGFLVLAIGESVILSAAGAPLAASGPAFAAGTALWAVSLLLIGAANEFPLGVRLLGAVSAVLFAAVSLMILAGEGLTPLSQPLPFFAYPLFVATILGWIWTLLKGKAQARTALP